MKGVVDEGGGWKVEGGRVRREKGLSKSVIRGEK